MFETLGLDNTKNIEKESKQINALSLLLEGNGEHEDRRSWGAFSGGPVAGMAGDRVNRL